MGHKVSVIHGVKSENFYEQGNAVNEIWVDDVEIISRLPFGDSDLEQASWSENWPKIPWHQFIIPLKREVNTVTDTVMADSTACICPAPQAIEFWPTTGPFSLMRDFNPNAAYILGFLAILIAAAIYYDGFGDLYMTWKYLLSARQMQQNRQSLGHQYPHILMTFSKRWLISFGKMFFACIILNIGMPLMSRGTEGLGANFFFLCHVNTIWLGITLISILIVAHADRLKQNLAAQPQPLEEGVKLDDTIGACFEQKEQVLEVEQVPALVGPCPRCNQSLLVLQKIRS